jgi:hypothetical protein
VCKTETASDSQHTQSVNSFQTICWHLIDRHTTDASWDILEINYIKGYVIIFLLTRWNSSHSNIFTLHHQNVGWLQLCPRSVTSVENYHLNHLMWIIHFCLTLSLLMSYIYIYIYGAPSKARNLMLYIYLYIHGRDFLLGILLLEPCISLTYAWKTNKYTNYSFGLLIMYGTSYMFQHYIAILRVRF